MADMAQVLATGGTALVSAAAGTGLTLPNQDASRPCRVVAHRHKCQLPQGDSPEFKEAVEEPPRQSRQSSLSAPRGCEYGSETPEDRPRV
jgi:hypothetical protein